MPGTEWDPFWLEYILINPFFRDGLSTGRTLSKVWSVLVNDVMVEPYFFGGFFGGFFVFCFFFFWSVFLGPPLWNTEVPRLGAELELQLQPPTITTAMPDPSQVCNLHHSSHQCWILNPLSEAKDQTCVPMDISRVCYHWATAGNPKP